MTGRLPDRLTRSDAAVLPVTPAAARNSLRAEKHALLKRISYTPESGLPATSPPHAPFPGVKYRAIHLTI
jgi:hypothetical protein